MTRVRIALLLLLVPLVGLGGEGQESATGSADTPLRFQAGATRAGLHFQHVSGSLQKKYILESMSGGVALLDYDNDGWLDIYLVNGSTLEELAAGRRTVSNALYRNLGDGTFEDVTRKARVSGGLWDMGAIAGDIDNDGLMDLFVTGFSRNTLYRNQGDGTFLDITGDAGLSDPEWSTGAAFGDYDQDGLIDLAVIHYVEFDPRSPPPRTPLCTYRGIDVQCGPRGLPGTRDDLYQNLGNSRFRNVSEETGVWTASRYYGLGCSWSDFDNDGDLDLFVANDSCPNFLFQNEGGKFRDVAMERGVGLNQDGREQAGMGVAFGDVDGDGRLDLIQTNFSDDKNTLYANRADYFNDVSYSWKLGSISWQYLGWGTVFLDADLDGWLDLFVANGHVYPEVDRLQIGTSYRQRDFLFHNESGKQYREVGLSAGLTSVMNTRGAAVGDFDNDGRVDIVVNHLDGPAELYWNLTPVAGQYWIGLDLRNEYGASVAGARAMVRAGGRKQTAEIQLGSSYLSQNDSRLVFGLGTAKPESIEITWPGGHSRRLEEWQLNAYNVVRLEASEKTEKTGPPSGTPRLPE